VAANVADPEGLHPPARRPAADGLDQV
jgi:hypothetical protein